MKVAESGIWGSLPLSGYSSRGARADPVQLVERSPMQYPSGCLTFANVQRGAMDLHFISTNDGRRRCAEIGFRNAPTSLWGCFPMFCQEIPCKRTCFDTTQRKRGRVDLRHDAMRTDDLHCGSCSASTQFSIHSLPPLWPKAPHGPNSKTT